MHNDIKPYIIMDLAEIKSHADIIIGEIEAGRYDDKYNVAFHVMLGHLMNHVVMAWHQSKMTPADLDAMTQDKFNDLVNSIPRFNLEYKLVELWP